jgi:uncharacterized membrane protein YedE/YeeE
MNIIEIIKASWPWYVAGPLIGLMVPLLLFIDNKQFGISSTMRDFCAYLLPKRLEYFNYNLKEHKWRNIFVFGIIIGAILSSRFLNNNHPVQISEKTIHDLKGLGLTDFSGIEPLEIFSWRALLSIRGFVSVIIGGFFVGFGARYADGCTSGHAIMGLSLMSPASLFAVLGFFTGGLISTHLLFPLLFK